MRSLTPVTANRLAPLFFLCCCVAPLTGCGSADDSALDIALVGDAETAFAQEPPLTPAAQTIRGAVDRGLVDFDAEGRVSPALAESWIVTDDGLSYIFRLRQSAHPEGEAMSANEAQTTLRQAIEAVQGTPLAIDLAIIDSIRARTGRVIEIQLTAPTPEFLQLLAQPELALRRSPDAAGPMRIAEQGDIALLVGPDPAGEGELAANTRPLRIRLAGPERAVELFQSSRSDIMLGGGIDALPHVKSGGLLRGTIRLDPTSGLFGLAFARKDEGPVSEPAIREALALAIDRAALIAPFNIGGWVPTTRLVASGMPGDTGLIGERWPDLDREQRLAIAARRVAAYRASAGELAPLRVALPPGRGGDLLYARLRSDFAAIGVTLIRAEPDSPADLYLVDEVARYARPEWFLNRFNCAAGDFLCSPEGDLLLAQARHASDPTLRSLLLTQAEAQLTGANVFIPFGPPVRFSLVRGGVEGFAINRWGVHPLPPLALVPG